MDDSGGRVWSYGPRAAFLFVPIVFIVLLLLAVVSQRAVGFPGKLDESVLWVILFLSLFPIGPLVFDVLVRRATTIEFMGFKLALSGALETLQASISVPTNIGVPGDPVSDNDTAQILDALRATMDKDVAVIDLESGQAWWETRLLILLAGAARRGRPLAIVFLATEGGVQRRFQGWAEPEALLQALLAANPEYRRCFERANAAAGQWSLVEPDEQPPQPVPPPGQVPLPLPPWMDGMTGLAQQHPWMSGDGRAGLLNPFVFEQFLATTLGARIEQSPPGPGPSKITVVRLKEVFGPVLQTAHIEESWSDRQKVESFLSTSGRYVAITEKGIYSRLMLRESGMAALVLSLTTQGPGRVESLSPKDAGLKEGNGSDKSANGRGRGPLTLRQGLIGLGLLVLFDLITETGLRVGLGNEVMEWIRRPQTTADHIARLTDEVRRLSSTVSHDADHDRLRRELLDEIRLSRGDPGQVPPRAGVSTAAVPPVAASVACPDAEGQSATAKMTTRIEPCVSTRPVAAAESLTTEQPAAAARPPEPRLLARWVQLISPNAECGSISAGRATGAANPGLCVPKLLVRAVLEERGRCEDVAFRPGTHVALPMKRRSNPDPNAFPVTLCEAEAEPGDKAVTFVDGSRIAWDGLERLRRVAVLGDTGCDNTKKVRQDCYGARSWPFREVALAATGIPHGSPGPDLAIHLGDYRYREGGVGDSDNWDNWYQDFFKPAEPLLLATPWVMLRGNHENCFGKHGAGWFFLLQPEVETVSRCAKDADRDPDNQPPYALDLRAGDDGPTLRLVVVDSANAKYRCSSWARDFAIRDEKRLRQLLRTSGTKAWLLTHYPVWDAAEDYLSNAAGYNDVVRCKSDFETQATVYRYREVMSAVVEEAHGRLEAIISGDTHNFQVLRVHDAAPDAAKLAATSSHPLQIIAGHGGTKLDPALGPRNGDKLVRTCDEGGDRVAYFQRKLAGSEPRRWIVGKAVCSYGYAAADRVGYGWTFSLQSFGGATESGRTACELGSADPSCYRFRDERHCARLGEDGDCLELRAAPS